MKVCIISKFPPLEGGIAAKTYWLARAYADAGLEVHVISNSNTAEKEYRIEGCYPHINKIPGVILHEVEKSFPWHIPEEKHSLAKLVDKFLEVHSEHLINIIDTGYLVPYGIAGYLGSRITGIPYIIRHGGSDIAKFLRQGHLPYLLHEAIKNANIVISDEENAKHFGGINDRIEIIQPYVPDPKFFFPTTLRESGPKQLAFIGKINWHWERKGLDLIVKALQYLPSDWKFKIIGQGLGMTRFLETFPDQKPLLSPFVPQWEVPHALRKSDFIFCLSVDEPIPSFSNILTEALSCGVKVVLLGPTRPNLKNFRNIENIIVLPYSKATQIAKALLESIEYEHVNANGDALLDDFAAYISDNIRILAQVATNAI
ncbi:MAG: hypothetical protein ACD_75C00434G0011 [uncultured bacterium]|nr:MAG: hypothetical protein ACD_75C00434G0011 [uncultured bacterium]